MIATLSKQGGRRYPQLRGTRQPALWLPNVAGPPVIGPTPADRLGIVPAEVRSMQIKAEVRSMPIPPEARSIKVR